MCDVAGVDVDDTGASYVVGGVDCVVAVCVCAGLSVIYVDDGDGDDDNGVVDDDVVMVALRWCCCCRCV